MKPTPETRESLLQDLLPASGGHSGPTRTKILEIVRGEKTRRHRRRTGLVLIAVAGCILSTVLRHETISPATTVTPPERSAPQPERGVREIDDEQLLAMLEGTPAAIMEGPNGQRTLLILEP